MNLEQLYDQAQQLLANKQHDAAYKILKKLDLTIPDHPGILYLLAICQSLGGNKDNAIKTYQRVLKLEPNFVEAMNNIGLDLKYMKRYQEALHYYTKALAIQPDFFDAKLNLASTLLAINEDQPASDLLIDLLSTAPSNPMVLANLGMAHLKTQNPEAALEHFAAARRLKSDNLEITRGYFSALSELNRWESLIEESNTLSHEMSEDRRMKEIIFSAHLQTNDWKLGCIDFQDAQNFCTAFDALCINSNPKILLELAKHTSEKYETSSRTLTTSTHHPRLRVGYISSDFKSHPIALLTNNLFCAHDKNLFEIHGIAIDRFPPTDNKYRQKIAADCCEFHEIGDMTNSEATNYLKKLELDILIDLNGHTHNNRISILAKRCAPIQIQYLGFPGTTGASFIDYTIGDPIITPPSHFGFYSEKIITLPECFQVNDSQRGITPQASRLLHQLPEEAFVFACFNQHIKFTPKVFDIWLRILKAVPRGILWLINNNRLQTTNLLTYAQSSGVSSERFVFADRLPYDQHLGRYALADLVLDTYPFNGGTTTSDALWGGAPVITMIGDTYASRMSASLLNSVGLKELITKTPQDYEALAIALSRDQERLQSLRLKLRDNLESAPAFKTNRFVNHLELGLTMAASRHSKGLKADHLFVPSLY